MKKIIFSLIALSSLSAQAIEVQNCEVVATTKTSSPFSHSKNIFVSAEFSNQAEFANTKLELTVREGKLKGAVNGQPNFIITGTPANGGFESAYHKGTIVCDAPVQVDYLLKFKPWNQFYHLDASISNGQIRQGLSIGTVDADLACFIGNAEKAADAIVAQADIKAKVFDAYRIDLTYDKRECTKPTGTNPDDYGCDAYRTVTKTMKFYNCNGDGWVDPRSSR